MQPRSINKKMIKPANWVAQKLSQAKVRVKNADGENMNLTFIRAFITNPLATGSVLPSSKALSNEMASHINQTDNGIIIELGAGTGAVTEALLQSGVNPSNLIVIEYSKDMVKKLNKRFPDIQIIEGDAADLKKLLVLETKMISAVISSLPLKSLPKSLTFTILDQISQILPEGGKYIQYTYGFGKSGHNKLDNFNIKCSKRIWQNLPPASVDVLIKNTNSIMVY